MQNLIQFLLRNGVLFLFLLLETICLFLVVKTNDRQEEIFFTSSNLIAGRLNDRVDQIVDYWRLTEKVDSLAGENARLRKRIYDSQGAGISSGQPGSDSTMASQFEVIPCRVINNSISSIKNYITLDKGSDDGIEPGMGVVDNHGIVGIVSNTSKRFSRVISILHSDAMISAAIRRNQYFGSLVWHGFNPRKMVLEAVPKHAEIFVGDTVETSGYSKVFPKGLMVGTVEKFNIEKGSNFYTVDVVLNNDISNLQQVYVIRNTLRMEQEQLEKEAEDE